MHCVLLSALPRNVNPLHLGGKAEYRLAKFSLLGFGINTTLCISQARPQLNFDSLKQN